MPSRLQAARAFAVIGALALLPSCVLLEHFAKADVLTQEQVAQVDSLLADTLVPTADEYGHPIDRTDRRLLLGWLTSGHFDSLTALLDARWAATQSDIKNEGQLYHVYEAFSRATPSIQPSLRRWVAAQPRMAAPHLATAYYWYGRANEARGGSSAAMTSQDQMAEMASHIEEGRLAVAEGMRYAPDHLIGHFLRLNFLRLGGAEPAAGQQILRSALEAQPASYYIRNEIMLMITPRWGGSLEIMRAFADQAQQHAEVNPKLRAFRNAAAREEAFLNRNDFGMALALLDQASFNGWDYHLALAYGDLHRQNGNRIESLRAYNRARSYLPQGRSQLTARSELLVELGALIPDPVVRERVWAEADRSLKELGDLRPPYAEPDAWLAKLAEGRARCSSESPPCITVYVSP